MQMIEVKKILNYTLVGIIIWLSIESLTIIVKQVVTFVLLQIELNEVTIFYTTQLLILLSVFLFTRFILIKILSWSNKSKSILIRIIVIYIIFEVLKFASLLTTPILIGQTELTSFRKFTELNENSFFKMIQYINKYVRIVIVGLTIVMFNQKKKT